ncbi:4-hydroxy-tetrahydrodipicolinate synthase [Flexibacterium corallicola]|uniref:4-hydroxy-tetrahydrodipicolinate synthase n=1 Tax=Flexibacterium corallicola TaxID=3037259 RepID=UPI00286FA574|nr:4-hydroxy-tetrahydrodipicolinate synthase [Pseudovibrio sp. M1P-2-3]
MFKGSITALVTPFKGGVVDEKTFQDFVDWQIKQGTHGLVPVGTTGESPTLSHAEHKRVIELCIEVAAGRVPVMAGAGSNNTQEALDFVKHAENMGANGLLIVTPYYNKPNQAGLKAHYKAVAQSAELPIYIYNIPGRSVIDMTSQTMAELHKECPNIVGVKDATANMSRVSEQREYCGKDFIQLSGEDITALGFMAHGGHGCISVTANVAPNLCSRFQEACLAGDFATALELQDKLAPLHNALFLEPNPTGVKYALSLLGKIENSVRLPLVTVSEDTQAAIQKAMKHAGLLD